jgi:hypothetical protein
MVVTKELQTPVSAKAIRIPLADTQSPWQNLN